MFAGMGTATALEPLLFPPEALSLMLCKAPRSGCGCIRSKSNLIPVRLPPQGRGGDGMGMRSLWKTWESNPLPPACEAGALPYELDSLADITTEFPPIYDSHSDPIICARRCCFATACSA